LNRLRTIPKQTASKRSLFDKYSTSDWLSFVHSKRNCSPVIASANCNWLLRDKKCDHFFPRFLRQWWSITCPLSLGHSRGNKTRCSANLVRSKPSRIRSAPVASVALSQSVRRD